MIKNKILIFYCLMIIFMIGCNSTDTANSPEKWSDDQASEWFYKKEWLGETALQVDTSLNKKEFAIHYLGHKEWWDKAFDFIKNEDLSGLSVGVHELDSQDVFVKVTEYYSKDPEKVFFEAHKDYSDIQYVISGEEYIELAPVSTAIIKTPYDAEKDIIFYEAKASQSLIGRPGTFFIIFPNEVHRPGIMIGDSVHVKKIVIKVRN